MVFAVLAQARPPCRRCPEQNEQCDRLHNGVAGHFRQYLYAAISADNGNTWSKPKFVAPQNSPDKPGSRGDYPFLCEAADGSVLLYYTRFGLRPGASYESSTMNWSGWMLHG